MMKKIFVCLTLTLFASGCQKGARVHEGKREVNTYIYKYRGDTSESTHFSCELPNWILENKEPSSDGSKLLFKTSDGETATITCFEDTNSEQWKTSFEIFEYTLKNDKSKVVSIGSRLYAIHVFNLNPDSKNFKNAKNVTSIGSILVAAFDRQDQSIFLIGVGSTKPVVEGSQVYDQCLKVANSYKLLD